MSKVVIGLALALALFVCSVDALSKARLLRGAGSNSAKAVERRCVPQNVVCPDGSATFSRFFNAPYDLLRFALLLFCFLCAAMARCNHSAHGLLCWVSQSAQWLWRHRLDAR
jgi:hypothetical protein